MRLTELSVLNYGRSPLSFREPLELTDFNLFYGPNESGKSLMIDALLKFLLKDDAESSPAGTRKPLFKHINRIDVKPEGFTYLRLNGESYKLPEEGTIPEITDDTAEINRISAEDFRNIFVVRNSKLAPSGHMGTDYYGNVTERLTGLQTELINRIRDELQEIGKITSTGNISNTQSDAKLKERYETAGDTLERIKKITDRAEEQELFSLENQLFRTRNRMNHIEETIQSLNQARKAKQYRKGSSELETLKEARNKLDKFGNVSEERLREWEKRQDQIESQQETIENRETEIKGLNDEIKELEEPIRNQKTELEELTDARESIDTEVTPLIHEAEDLQEQMDVAQTRRPLYGWLTALTGTGTIGTLVAAVLVHNIYGYLLSGILAITFLTTLYLYRNIIVMESDYEAKLGQINNSLMSLGLEGENLAEIKRNVRGFRKRVTSVEAELEALQNEKTKYENRIGTLREQIEDEHQQKIEEATETIETIRDESDYHELSKYREAVQEKKELEETVKDCRNALETLFEAEGSDLDQRIRAWERQLDELSSSVDETVGEEYDKDRLKKLQRERDQLQAREEELESNLNDVRDDLRTIRNSLHDVFAPEDAAPPTCDDLSDLQVVREELETFRERVESRRVNALEAITIFEELETEERSKIGDLFGAESLVSDHFSRITDERFDSVDYNPEENAIYVRTLNEERLEPYQLSGGTYDQLYFAIRLALGENLLEGSPGFFILDDPFIKSDAQRLKRQMNLLRSVVNDGWQILYFSAKDEVLDYVEEKSWANCRIFRKGQNF